MKILLCCSLCLLFLLSCLSEPADSRSLHLGSCSVSVHTHELRKYYSTIRSDVLAGDNDIGLKLLEKSLIKDVQEGQTCCFLRLVLRFYVERVFGNYASSEPQQQRGSSALANAFVSIRRDIHKCHCHCEEETQRKIDSIHADFIKLEVGQAAQKAMGELDTVLEWLEGLNQKIQS
ncbi:interleukin 19 like [Echeneis naucrates]|uniref:interleukin 19 like n=1 Tax=Echeneis naucrates TaxID=173247 RepID=UPI001113557D|nr:interleukin-20-like [Echeneis naucrates]